MEQSAAFPFVSRYLEVGRHRIHYVEQGAGRPILFIHGNPTWSYQWRNILSSVSNHGRCIAFDLLGFGRSDKPDIEYTFDEHAEIVNGFIGKLQLKHFIMVLHDWGAAFGFWYAMHNPENVAGIATFEPLILPRTWDEYTGERRKRFEMFMDKKSNYDLIQVKNYSIETLQERVLHKERMTKEVMDGYREPFPTIESRKAMRRFPEMLPIGESSETYGIFKQIEAGLPLLNFPILLMTADPGSSMNKREVSRVKAAIGGLEVVSVGPGLHHLQEDQPEAIADSTVRWLKEKRLVSSGSS